MLTPFFASACVGAAFAPSGAQHITGNAKDIITTACLSVRSFFLILNLPSGQRIPFSLPSTIPDIDQKPTPKAQYWPLSIRMHTLYASQIKTDQPKEIHKGQNDAVMVGTWYSFFTLLKNKVYILKCDPSVASPLPPGRLTPYFKASPDREGLAACQSTDNRPCLIIRGHDKVTHSPAYNKVTAEIGRFLDILEYKVQDLNTSTDRLMLSLHNSKQGGMASHFSQYMKNRDLISECWAFSIVIERRLEQLPEDPETPFRRRFTGLTVKIWATLLDCSLKFLDALSRETNLPLGSREVFVREIKNLYDANRWLSDPRYEGLISEDMQAKQRQAERILSTIIDRAPALLELG